MWWIFSPSKEKLYLERLKSKHKECDTHWDQITKMRLVIHRLCDLMNEEFPDPIERERIEKKINKFLNLPSCNKTSLYDFYLEMLQEN